MDRVLDIDEISLAIKQHKTGKVAGMDGLPVEFYQAFKDRILVLLYNVS